jgi:hypothetical protein
MLAFIFSTQFTHYKELVFKKLSSQLKNKEIVLTMKMFFKQSLISKFKDFILRTYAEYHNSFTIPLPKVYFRSFS